MKHQTTIIYAAVFALSLALAAGLLYNLTGSRKSLQRLQQDVETKEQQAATATPAGDEERARWSEQQDQLNRLLLSDEGAPQFLSEITKVASESGIQRLSMNTEETNIDTSKSPSP